MDGTTTRTVPSIPISPGATQGNEAVPADQVRAATPNTLGVQSKDGGEPPNLTSSPVARGIPSFPAVDVEDTAKVATKLLGVAVQQALIQHREVQAVHFS